MCRLVRPNDASMAEHAFSGRTYILFSRSPEARTLWCQVLFVIVITHVEILVDLHADRWALLCTAPLVTQCQRKIFNGKFKLMKVSNWLTAGVWYEYDSPESEGWVPSQVTSQKKWRVESVSQVRSQPPCLTYSRGTTHSFRLTKLCMLSQLSSWLCYWLKVIESLALLIYIIILIIYISLHFVWHA